MRIAIRSSFRHLKDMANIDELPEGGGDSQVKEGMTNLLRLISS